MKKILLTIMVIISMQTKADLQVMTDTGNTLNINQFITELQLKMVFKNNSAVNKSSYFTSPQYPVKSRLKPGIVESHQISNTHLSTPIFIIGDDELSRAWLIDNKERLRNLQAVGLVTNIESEDKLHELEEESGLTLSPSSLTGIESYAPIKNYPVLWDKTGISQ